MKKIKHICCGILVILVSACGAGGGATVPPVVASEPIASPVLAPKSVTSVANDPSVSADGAAVMKYLADLSTDKTAGVIAGQNMGHGNQVTLTSGLLGYEPLVGQLEKQTGELPGVIGVDYEHDLIFTPAQLSQTNAVLVNHWNKGGLVTINWSPQNPWLNDELNLAGNPGLWSNTRQQGGNMKDVNLADLLDPNKPVSLVWRRKLDRIAAGLQELQAAGVVVLWRPMQEMNWPLFWWGTSVNNPSGTAYANLWRDMHDYFTKTKGLHNLLWVYSPYSLYDVEWAYPGADYVDVVSATSYDDTLTIPNYEKLVGFGKPVGMGELGAVGAAITANGSFDNREYANKLIKKYPAVAYWVSWHNWSWGDGSNAYMAIVSNQYAKELMTDQRTITVNRLAWQTYR